MENKMKKEILRILKEAGKDQINFELESARELYANKILNISPYKINIKPYDYKGE